MAGTFVKDANEVDLLADITLTTAGGGAGTAWEADWPQEVTFFLETGTVTGTSPTFDVTIEGCETEDFTTADVVAFAAFPQVGDEDDVTHELTTRVTTKFARANVTITGTSGDYAGTTLIARQTHFHRTALNSAAALA